jgi:hypothetical protein
MFKALFLGRCVWRSAHRGPLCVSLWLVALALMAGCTGFATKFYSANDFHEGALPERTTSEIQVILGDQMPKCQYTEIGTIIYDWARDGIFTSQSVALDGTIAKAAHLGASGIYKIRTSTGATVGMVSGSGSFAVASAGSEVGIEAVAFVCDPSGKMQPLAGEIPTAEAHVAPDASRPDESLDTVLLTNGGRVRGTIFDDDPRTGVGIKLPDNTTRRIKSADVKKVLYRSK